MKSGEESETATESGLLLDVNEWLLKVAQLRHSRTSLNERESQRVHAERVAQSILLVRQAEELLTRIRAWINGYAIVHERLSKKVLALRDAATPGAEGDALRHWSIADDLPPGRGKAFRRALNDLMREVGE